MLKRVCFLIFLLFIACSKETINYTLTVNVNPPDGGFVNPSGGTVPEGQQISLQATADSKYVFENWSGDETGTSSNISIIMDGNKTLTANFRIDPFYLDNNGVTIKARDWVTPGLKGFINEIEYTAVDLKVLKEMSYDRKDLSKVVTTLIDDMTELFYPPVDSNGDGVINFLDSFFHEFNDDISSWDVSNVTNMKAMFYGAKSFNQDISNWDVSKVEDMQYMFSSAESFNQDINNWDVSNVTNMSGIFSGAKSFNYDIGNWDVSNVTNMKRMFNRADSFNQDIGDWDVSKVKDMGVMFYNAKSFNQDIGNWDVSNVEKMNQMFGNYNIESSFNQDISNWDVSNVITMQAMFMHNNSFNQDIGNWNVGNVEEMDSMFEKSIFNQDIGNWDVSKVKYMSRMFRDNSNFNQDIGNWDVSSLIIENWHASGPGYQSGLARMFENSSSFNQDISSWCVFIFKEEPFHFSYNSPMMYSKYRPKWGEPCN